MDADDRRIVLRRNPVDRVSDAAATLGFVVMLLHNMTESRSNFDIRRHVRDLIEPAIAHRRIQIYFNEAGAPVGYLAWAHLSTATSERVALKRDTCLHLSEWDEGEHLWIVAACSPYRLLREIWCDAREQLFDGARNVNWISPHGHYRPHVKSVNTSSG